MGAAGGVSNMDSARSRILPIALRTVRSAIPSLPAISRFVQPCRRYTTMSRSSGERSLRRFSNWSAMRAASAGVGSRDTASIHVFSAASDCSSSIDLLSAVCRATCRRSLRSVNVRSSGHSSSSFGTTILPPARGHEKAAPGRQDDVFGVEPAGEFARETRSRECRQSRHVAVDKDLSREFIPLFPAIEQAVIGWFGTHVAVVLRLSNDIS